MSTKTAEQITEALADGIDNYDGEGRTGLPVADALLGIDVTVADCQDDRHLLADYVEDGMPRNPGIELRMSTREIAHGIYNHINNNDGGFIAVEV